MLDREWEDNEVEETFWFCQCVLEVWKRTEVLDLAEVLEVYWVVIVLEMWKSTRCSSYLKCSFKMKDCDMFLR